MGLCAKVIYFVWLNISQNLIQRRGVIEVTI